MKKRPLVLRKDGKPAFVVLPYAEYRAMFEAMENAEDCRALVESDLNVAKRPPITLEEAQRYFEAKDRNANRGRAKPAA